MQQNVQTKSHTRIVADAAAPSPESGLRRVGDATCRAAGAASPDPRGYYCSARGGGVETGRGAPQGKDLWQKLDISNSSWANMFAIERSVSYLSDSAPGQELDFSLA